MLPEAKKGPVSAGPVFDTLASATRFLTGVVLVLLVVLVCAEALLRGAFNHSLGFAEELTGYCVVFLTFLGAALALRSDTLFQVNFLFGQLSDEMRRWTMRIFVVLALIICCVLAVKAWDLMMSSLSRGKFAPTVLRTPLWLPQLIVPTGFLVIGIFLVEKFMLTFRSFGKPQ